MKYAIRASETIYYYFEVEAESQEQAYEKALNYSPLNDDIVEADNFEIYDMSELKGE